MPRLGGRAARGAHAGERSELTVAMSPTELRRALIEIQGQAFVAAFNPDMRTAAREVFEAQKAIFALVPEILNALELVVPEPDAGFSTGALSAGRAVLAGEGNGTYSEAEDAIRLLVAGISSSYQRGIFDSARVADSHAFVAMNGRYSDGYADAASAIGRALRSKAVNLPRDTEG